MHNEWERSHAKGTEQHASLQESMECTDKLLGASTDVHTDWERADEERTDHHAALVGRIRP